MLAAAAAADVVACCGVMVVDDGASSATALSATALEGVGGEEEMGVESDGCRTGRTARDSSGELARSRKPGWEEGGCGCGGRAELLPEEEWKRELCGREGLEWELDSEWWLCAWLAPAGLICADDSAPDAAPSGVSVDEAGLS
jgi:hypothetical protein